MKKVKFFPLYGKNKKKIYFFSVNTKNISSHVLKIPAISLVLRTREISDIFITFDEIYLVSTLKKVNILYIFISVLGYCLNQCSLCTIILDFYFSLFLFSETT